ncbi:unnamed protein product [Microthlaspi erraticum]|uniref:F-box domain-containing protein n=1 Tax=Microthlaspi erraticum TaxID=1685480 RepID=A0A6D2I733_9BRAS|nr:unnamed protein product [Microthlaspi erraticum]
MSSPEKKKRKKTTTKKPLCKPSLLLPPTPESTPDPYLPDDLLLSCFPQVSSLYYPTLSLVSKRFRSLLASPELYKIRSVLGHTESCLYVYSRFYAGPNFLWFTLCRRPNRTLTEKKKQSSNILVPDFQSHLLLIVLVVGLVAQLLTLWGEFKWLNTKESYWRILKGLFGLPNYLSSWNTSSQVQLADYGGKMAVLWDRHDYSSKCKGRNVWCAVITLERRSSEEIWGTVEWSEVVLKVPKDFQFVDVLSATV